jgi:predicted phosphohydrolase
MKTIVWATDLHLNYAGNNAIEHFLERVKANKPDGVILTGDLTEAPDLIPTLAYLEKGLEPIPVYFVLGNHDYYEGSIKDIRSSMELGYGPKSSEGMRYLPACDPMALTLETALIGEDGWYDGGYGNWFGNNSVTMLSDITLIKELVTEGNDKQILYQKIQNLAKESATWIKLKSNKAIDDGFKNVLIATHVPPFIYNAVFDPRGPGSGKPSNENWLPGFASKIMGDCLLNLSEDNPEVMFTVLCGHSHGDATYSPRPNLTCKTGYALYGKPAMSIKELKVI